MVLIHVRVSNNQLSLFMQQPKTQSATGRMHGPGVKIMAELRYIAHTSEQE